MLAVTAGLFLLGALLLVRATDPLAAEPNGGPLDATGEPPSAGPVRTAATSFGVLFAAEWGDLSQLLTAGLAARYEDPVSVFVGAWGALAVIAAVAVVAGRRLVRVIPVRALRLTAAALFTALGLLTALEAAGVQLPVG